jgi:hypothetical protein
MSNINNKSSKLPSFLFKNKEISKSSTYYKNKIEVPKKEQEELPKKEEETYIQQKISNQIQLTKEQLNIYNETCQFLSNKHENCIVITGGAGTGKTTLTKYIVNHLMLSSYGTKLCICAPTHKAKHILSNIINRSGSGSGSIRIIPIEVITLASLLCKIRQNSYIGVKNFESSSNDKLLKYKIFILDEVSMVNDKDLKLLIDFVINRNCKLIMIGDVNQLPSPSQELYINDKNELVKKDSDAFTSKTWRKLELKTNIRQNERLSSISKLLLDDINIKDIETEELYIADYISKYIYEYSIANDKSNIKILTYTNAKVTEHNNKIRESMNFIDKFNINEILIGYNNVGNIVENSKEYIIMSVGYIRNYKIGTIFTLCGHLVRTNDNEMFIIDIYNSDGNYHFLCELIRLADLVNTKHSTKKDFSNYFNLRNNVIFNEDIYKFKDEILPLDRFKDKHPLLFTKVEYINGSSNNSLVNKINTIYGEQLINDRLSDNKPIVDNETLADKFKVIEKDIDYGYAITTHKSQGSTYKTVFIDIKDFNSIDSNKFNYKFNMNESKSKELKQLKYVAFTRASDNIYLI